MSRAREFADLAGSSDAGGITGKNLIINGAMQIAQYNVSKTAVTGGGYHTVDRFISVYGGSPDQLLATYEQSTDAPAGFSNSFKFTVTTAETTLDANERLRFSQRIEGQNLQHLRYGTSNPEYLTLSFYVKSNVTGTYGLNLDNRSSARIISASYTINAADTWEKKTVSFVGDTSGSLDNDNTRALDVNWYVAAGTDFTSGTFATSWQARPSNLDDTCPSGQVNLIDTVNNYFAFTGVQLEIGSQATPFEHRSFADELARCQRYYVKQESVYGSYHTFGFGTWFSATRFIGYVQMPVPMRTNPSLAVSGSVAAWQGVNPRGTISGTIGIASVGGNGSPTIIELDVTSGLSGSSTGSHGFLKADNDSSALLEFNAEL